MTELAQPSDNTSLHPSELAAASAALTSRASVPDSIDPIDSIASHEGFQGATEADVSYWAASVRTAFGRNREQFNFAICDALATALHPKECARLALEDGAAHGVRQRSQA